MGKIVKILTKARRIIPPTGKGSSHVVGKSGALAIRARDGAVWASTVAYTSRVGRLPGKIARSIPWLLGGSIAWELGDQLFDILNGGKMMDEEGSPIASVSDACYNIHDHMTDKSRLKTMCRDLNKIRNGISAESDQEFVKTMTEGDRYTLDDEAATLVIMYQARREMAKREFIFTKDGLTAVYFDDFYVACYNPNIGLIETPTRLSWSNLHSLIAETTEALCDPGMVTDVIRQFADLDGFLKLTEFRLRVLEQGTPDGGSYASSNSDYHESSPIDSDPLRDYGVNSTDTRSLGAGEDALYDSDADYEGVSSIIDQL